jgi:hypothetical protein
LLAREKLSALSDFLPAVKHTAHVGSICVCFVPLRQHLRTCAHTETLFYTAKDEKENIKARKRKLEMQFSEAWSYSIL